MNLELSDQEFRYLLDLVYIGNWVMNSTREHDRIKEYDRVEGRVFSQCLTNKMPSLVELYQGEMVPSRAFADGGIHEVIETYEDTVFYEILAEEMAVRDMEGLPMTIENYTLLKDRIERYMREFDQNGMDHVSVDLSE